MKRIFALALLLTGAATVHAEPRGRVYGAVGSWAYDISGSYTNTQRLDLEDDLGLKVSARQDYAIGYTPDALGLIPAIEFGYTRIAAEGQQRFQTLPTTGLEPVTGVLLPTETVVDDRTRVNDFELTLRWPLKLGPFTVLGGVTVTRLDGSVMVADQSNGQVIHQQVDEIFPLLSVGLAWQPLPALTLSLSGEAIRYDGNRADELEARVLWKFLGPVGLQAGYRQRRYKIDEPMNSLDARVSGALIALVMELPV